MIIFIKGLLLIVIGLYVIALVTAAFFSDRMIFQPQHAGYRDQPGILKLTSSSGVKISATYLSNPEAIFTVLFSHGNAEDIGDDQQLLERIKAAGFAVFAYDYQGYGTSEGRPSERHAYEDENAAYNFLVQSMHVQPNRIIAFGRSVGGGPACDLASRRPVAGLILESAFTSAFRVMTRVRVLPFR
jgi:alpha-beta hydrolase superfamily lysophospholipase